MRYNKIFFLAAPLFVFGCSVGQIDEPAVIESGSQSQEVSEEWTVPGVMSIKVTEALADRLLEYADGEGVLNADGMALISMPDVNVTKVSTAFRIGGKFEKKQRQAGLHQWFRVEYDQNVSLTKATGAVNTTEGILKAEPVMKVKSLAVEMNDPDYLSGYLWQYNNYGQFNIGFTEGIDIRLQEAWDTYGVFGDPKVIVAIGDRGVQYSHEDLRDNIWVNDAELNGTPGVDDDENGYIDDVYGFNFVYGDAVIHPQDHGTHVAGIVGAVNNNGIGICGVAGGRYPDQKGVRMMCVQLMEEGVKDSGNTYLAFQYAAENGAVIMQNSWGYSSPEAPLQDLDKTAIDYFVENAGMDENGNQVGPMKGGLVVFAAGNSTATTGYPAQYEKALAVASVGPTGRYAFYTNYGDWVDICAPGGDGAAAGGDYRGQIRSTVTGGTYSYDQGTSMACPQVSGVAALVLSTKDPEDGFTADNLFKLLVNTADESIYQYNMSRMGMLGSGLLDATAALGMALDSPEASPLTSFDVTAEGNSLVFTAAVPANAVYYRVYYSTSPFDVSDLSSADMAEYRISPQDDASNGRKTFTLDGLRFSTEYWCTVVAANVIGEEATPAAPKSVTTKENRAPVVTPDQDGDIVVTASGSVVRTYSISEPDGQTYEVTWSTAGNQGVAFESISDRTVQLSIDALKTEPGEYTCSITVTDVAGLATVYEIPFTILQNNAPKFLGNADFCIDGVGGSIVFNPYDYFYDADADNLTFAFNVTEDLVISHTVLSDGRVELRGLTSGSVVMAVTATDPRKASASGGFTVTVRRNTDKELDIYPNPASKVVKLRTKQEGYYTVTITSASGSEVYTSGASISLASPFSIDVSGFAPGVYNVTTSDDSGKSWTGNFVKI